MTLSCCLCGHERGLRPFGMATQASKLKVCVDVSACMDRQAAKRGAVPPKPPRTLERHELPSEVERHANATERLAKELTKPDKRPVCPKHGPKNTVAIEGKAERRFVCCGRVQEVEPVIPFKADGIMRARLAEEAPDFGVKSDF